MKKSNHVPAALLMTVAAVALSGCNRKHYDYSREVRRCVDDQGRVFPDYECERRRTYGTGGGYYSYPHWAYGGATGSDGRLRNYRMAATPGNEVVSSSGRVITRGGFGSSSSSRGGGGFFSGWGS